MQTCSFCTNDGKPCDRSKLGDSQYCSLHFGYDRKLTDTILENPHFEADFQTVIDAKDGDWRGFVFPDGIKLPEKITFKIDARGCRFASFEQDKVIFKVPVDFSESIFKSRLTLRSSVFEDTVNFNLCLFEGPVQFLHVQCLKDALFYRAEFSGRTLLRASFNKMANFNEAVFRESVHFTGWAKINVNVVKSVKLRDSFDAVLSTESNTVIVKRICALSMQISKSISRFVNHVEEKLKEKIRIRFRSIKRQFAKVDPDTEVFWVFEDKGSLEGVVFMKPDQTLFSGVDLSRVYFRGTNLRGIRFFGVRWWQPIFKRNGLHDEVFIRRSKDGPFRHRTFPILEETCRNTRVALEENRNFNAASDFYIAEMEAARAQLPICRRCLFSVNALYRIVSYYGTSVARAIIVLFILYFSHFYFSLRLVLPSESMPQVQQLSEVALRSLKVLLLTTPDPKIITVSTTQSWCDIIFRLLGPIQIAMVALAFRSRIKRH